MKTESTLTVGIDIRLIGKGRTGDEVVFFQLVRELIRRKDAGLRYELFTDESSDDRIAALRLRLEALGRSDVDIVSLSARNRFWWNGIALPWRLFRSPVDIFHTQYILPLLWPRRTKIVTHIHDISFRIHPEWIGWKDRLFLALLIPRTLRRSDRIIAPSEFTRKEIIAQYGVPADRVVVIENAAPEEWFLPTAGEAIERVAKKYGVDPGRYLISSGTMQPRKNIPFLIAAFREANRSRPLGLKLVLTGDPAGHNADLRAKAADENIVYPGYVSDVDLQSLVAGAAGYVFPSLYEGFGIPIEEAIAKGTPVLASDIPAFREVGGGRITYFDPVDLASLAETLYTFSIDILSEKAEKKPFSVSDKRYSWVASAEKLALVYRSLASSRP